MNIIFQINGGLGKSVMATAVCKSIKAKYPNSKLIVVSGHPDIFLNNPYVDRCHSYNDLKYFYQNYIEKKEVLYLGQEVYSTNSFVNQEKNLIEIWCDMFDLPVLDTKGEIYLTKREIDFYTKKHLFNKPVLVLQTSGSAGELMYNWSRDMPPTFVKSIINKFKEYNIYHVRGENQISYDGVIPFTDNIRAVCVLLANSEKRILIDSSCQHIATALGLSSSVLWIGTNPKVFGYETNNNILSATETKKVSLSNSFLSKYELVSNISDFPFNDESEIFTEETLNKL